MNQRRISADHHPAGGLIGRVAAVEMNGVPVEVAAGRFDDNSRQALGAEIQTQKAILRAPIHNLGNFFSTIFLTAEITETLFQI